MTQRPAAPTFTSSFSLPSISYKSRQGDATTQVPKATSLHKESGMENNSGTDGIDAWSRIRAIAREPAAEFLGTMILVMFGNAANCQVTLSGSAAVASSPKGDYLALSFGWATGIALGAWISGGISGGHINPAITISQAVFRGFSWRKVPAYVLAQIFGAWAGAGLVYANYYRAIQLFEAEAATSSVSGTAAALFATFPAPYLSNVQSFFQEFLATAILVMAVLAATDKQNGPPPGGLVPLVLFIVMLGISSCFGMQTSFSLNPARDIGPRIMCWMAGYGRELWKYRSQYWLYTPVMGPIAGALTGTAVYDLLLFTGPESILNRIGTKHTTNMPQESSDSPTAPSSGHHSV